MKALLTRSIPTMHSTKFKLQSMHAFVNTEKSPNLALYATSFDV
jgi:hypothetical protein